ncbi:MAG: patatin-like phospholipase family protein [Akkermansiaceae bacterium]|jgi:NTE family protein|nr:patatin-like phospholipase family protein [Akkermansiaceae bacterium]MDP4645825.1 patatin-like phospholipase family protein [Akkermansiaceae bacterium]MDP4720560.1 patatin-like phospholipase family protein [Akkermansiaceae bacterium]MDP4779002.1 patatin-like phospholipase family protein [Akkermansiaceae bacterium]MDP4847994.1 patatin-like phospholipase family protein [Akkermansiaceae bacterium]
MFEKIIRRLKGDSRLEKHGRPLEVPAGRLKLGLALSSGGARGLAHVGVLQVLEENNIEIHAISGSSMGSYVGSLWAAGFSGKELANLAAEMHDRRQLWKLADPVFPPMRGLFHGLKAKAHLERSLGDLRFEDLERKLLVITADLDTKERLVLRSGKIADAVHASCAMPGIIAPVILNGRRCVDGGVVDPVPCEALRKFADVDRVIAVSVIPTFDEVDAGMYQDEDDLLPRSMPRRFLSAINRNLNFLAKGNIVDTFRQSIRCAQVRIAHDSVKRADLCLRPEHFHAPWNDYSNFERFIDAGRKVALDHLDEIRALAGISETPPDEKSDDSMVGDRVA